MTLWSKSECYYPTKNGWTLRNNLQKSQKRLWEKLDSLLALLRILGLWCSKLNVAWQQFHNLYWGLKVEMLENQWLKLLASLKIILILKQFIKMMYYLPLYQVILMKKTCKAHLPWSFLKVSEVVQNLQKATKLFKGQYFQSSILYQFPCRHELKQRERKKISINKNLSIGSHKKIV